MISEFNTSINWKRLHCILALMWLPYSCYAHANSIFVLPLQEVAEKFQSFFSYILKQIQIQKNKDKAEAQSRFSFFISEMLLHIRRCNGDASGGQNSTTQWTSGVRASPSNKCLNNVEMIHPFKFRKHHLSGHKVVTHHNALFLLHQHHLTFVYVCIYSTKL